jgi:hypothetical protein
MNSTTAVAQTPSTTESELRAQLGLIADWGFRYDHDPALEPIMRAMR